MSKKICDTCEFLLELCECGELLDTDFDLMSEDELEDIVRSVKGE